MKKMRRFGTAAATAGALVGVLAASAWACVPSGGSSSGTLAIAPSEARPGREVTVTGTAPSNGPVDLRLSGTQSSVKLMPARSSGEGPYRFEARLVVPIDAQPGRSLVIAKQDGKDWQGALVVLNADGTMPADLSQTGTEASEGSSGGLGRLAGAGFVATAAVGFVVASHRRRARTLAAPLSSSPSQESRG